MLRILGKIPNHAMVAISGGVDSMAALSFIRNIPSRQSRACFFHHGTDTSDKAHSFLVEWCAAHSIELITGSIIRERHPDESPEEYWRNQRYDFYKSLETDCLIQAHHLDDEMEQWLFSSMHGEPTLIPYTRMLGERVRIMRPFLLCRKEQLRQWCITHHQPWVEDASNMDVKYARNRIRHNIIPEALKINPGLGKVVARHVQAMYDKQNVAGLAKKI